MARRRFLDMTKEPSDKVDKANNVEAWKFLMKKGLTRDRANYVTLLIRFRQEAEALRRLVRDPHVLDCLDGMSEILGDEVSEIYEMQHYEDEGN